MLSKILKMLRVLHACLKNACVLYPRLLNCILSNKLLLKTYKICWTMLWKSIWSRLAGKRHFHLMLLVNFDPLFTLKLLVQTYDVNENIESRSCFFPLANGQWSFIILIPTTLVVYQCGSDLYWKNTLYFFPLVVITHCETCILLIHGACYGF